MKSFKLLLVMCMVFNFTASKVPTDTPSQVTASEAVTTETPTEIITETTTEEEEGVPEISTLCEFCEKALGMTNMMNCTCDNLLPMLPGVIEPFCGANERKCDEEEVIDKGTEYLTFGALEHLRVSVSLIASIVGIIGNILVIAVYSKVKISLSKCRLLITMLAFCDLAFAVILFTVVIPSIWTPKWIYGNLGCKLLIGFNDLGVLVAMGIILVIAVERYIGITRPLKRGLSKKKVIVALTINYVAAVAMIIPEMFVLNVTEERQLCTEKWSHKHSSLIYTYVLLVVYFVAPCLAIAYLYIASISALHGFVKQQPEDRIENPAEKHRMEERRKDNKRIMLILITILISFICFVLPNRLIWVIFAHLGEDINNLTTSRFLVLKYIALLTYPFHVAINPVIYCVCDRTFREKIIKFVRDMPVKRLSTRGAAYSTSRGTTSSIISNRVSKISLPDLATVSNERNIILTLLEPAGGRK